MIKNKFSERKVKVKSLSHVWLSATPRAVAHQAPPSMGFPRQEYWSGVPFPLQGNLPDPGMEPGSPALQADALPPEPAGKPNKLSETQKGEPQREVPLLYRRLPLSSQLYQQP